MREERFSAPRQERPHGELDDLIEHVGGRRPGERVFRFLVSGGCTTVPGRDDRFQRIAITDDNKCALIVAVVERLMPPEQFGRLAEQ